jgi:hypothetical protein
MNSIVRFEALAEQLVEGTFARLFAGRISPLEVATHLVRAMEDNQVVHPGGFSHAPTHYSIHLHPDDQAALDQAQPALTQELAAHVVKLATQAGLALETPPEIQVVPDEAVKIHQTYIEARWAPQEAAPVERTREMEVTEAEDKDALAVPPGRPFLILEGHRHVNLLQAVVAIGRSLDNDVIIEDARVSRHHAQLRRRYGRYVLYDLGSSGGTKINDYPVEECVLHAGDVISLAGVQVVYSEDPSTPIPQPDSEDTPFYAAQEPESQGSESGG